MIIDEETKKRLIELPIEDVAAELGIQVRRHRALCFMHDDHHPSLAFMPSSNRWKCFVCDVWGNTIDLVQRYNNINFVDSCLWLARHFNIEIKDAPYREDVVKPRPAVVQKKEAQVVLDKEMLQVLVERLTLTDKAKQFFYEERKYSPEVIDSLGIRSADSDAEIINILIARFPTYRILQSGLAYLKQGQWHCYFNTPCIFFPYYDEQGQLETLQARYLGNPEEHQRFQFPRGSKTSIFNLPVLSQLKDDEILFISEGVTDCIALLSSGKKAIAVPSASTLKPEQLKSVVSHPLGMYPDNDEPGERLFSQIEALVAQNNGRIFRLQLPDGCKDYSVYYRQLIEQNDLISNPLYPKLREVRWQLAKQYKKPVFIVASNRTLREMVEQRPTNREALRCIYGMGVKNIEIYGEAFLKVINQTS